MATAEQTDIQMVTVEIDGQSVSVPAGSMIIEASDKIGIDIPRFCYHRKLSIAANCRMCLVDVEKAPKPLPACATPVAEGMKVFTESRRAVDAQRGVMEFLLINHPLDCPICDQGGECELQDLAMGYGRSVSRFTERKRVVKDKNLGSLIATDMTRCIHCTRCVRFLEEIAGTTELGGIGRGEHTEISTFVERNINSELSGNIIDLCPVGALTNKPFRFSARPWEMRAKPGIATHDNLGSNVFYHVRGHHIMRSVPKDNEHINECWLSDRDRYSHYGLKSPDVLTEPQIKINGQWQSASWEEALDVARTSLQRVMGQDDAQLAGLISPRATNEEHHLFQALIRGLGSEHVDHRLRIHDCTHPQMGQARMDMASRDWSKADAILLIGSNIRHDQPILGHKVRTAWRKNHAVIMDLNAVAYETHFEHAERLIIAPQQLVNALAQLAQRMAEKTGQDLPQWAQSWVQHPLSDVDAQIVDGIVGHLETAHRGLVVLGDQAMCHRQAHVLRALSEWLAEAAEVSLCILGGPANSQGAWKMGAIPGPGGLDAQAMLSKPQSVYCLYDFEPDLDTANGQQACRTLEQADSVIVFSAFDAPALRKVADVMLPVATALQTDGSYINLDGIEQRFEAIVPPSGQAKPGWKVLRQLGFGLGLSGFDFVDCAELWDCLDSKPPVKRPDSTAPVNTSDIAEGSTLIRVGDVGIYHTDGLVRRSEPLQQSDHAAQPVVRLHSNTAQTLGLKVGQPIRVRQGQEEGVFEWAVDDRVASHAVWLSSGHPAVSALGETYGPIEIVGVTA